MVYINPSESFGSKEVSKLAEIQIDNSLLLGWESKDILFYTNFPYSFRGVEAIVLSGSLYCLYRPLSTKTLTAAYLLSKHLLKEDDVCWVHDLDAFQLEKFNVNLDGFVAGFTDYGWRKKWSLGSYFVTNKAVDIFRNLSHTIEMTHQEDERAMVKLTNENTISGFKKLNITYNFGMRHVKFNYDQAELPLKVVHFHPQRRGRAVLDSFMYGKNELGFPLITRQLSKLLMEQGFQWQEQLFITQVIGRSLILRGEFRKIW